MHLFLTTDGKFQRQTGSMASVQTETLKKKTADVNRILASEKQKFGCYDVSCALR